MNTVRICGGVGNQLFQYAFGKFQEFLGISVDYDISWYNKPQVPPRLFRLCKYKIDLDKKLITSKVYKRTILEKGFNSKSIIDIGYKYSGYWQSSFYHTNIFPVLKKEYQVKENFYTKEFLDLKRKITQSNSVSLHVRRGDYLGKNNQYVLPLEYYINALKILSLLKGNYVVFVFSDDIAWCKEYFPNFYFVQLDDYLELELMSCCKHNIIANSTFSWWAAYLNNNSNKIVIAPKKWVARKKDQDLIDRKRLILHDWIKL